MQPNEIRRQLIQSARPLSALAALMAAPAWAHDGDSAPAAPARDDEIVVTGRYEVEALSTPQHVLPLLDTPQTVTVVPDELLSEQGRRTLRDSLRNITGISFQAGEGNPPGGGDSFSARGFSARDDIFVDGIRGPGNYFRDPFYAERIEVTKGPASAFAGRGNVGGTVNIVTRAPMLRDSYGAELSAGTHDLFRATTDLNVVLSEAGGIALRLNALGHSADEPGRDVVENERWAVAPALGFGIGGSTQFVVSYLHLEQDDLPDFGLPNARNNTLAGSGFEGRAAPVERSNFYGYSTDYRDIEVDMVTARLEHDFSDAVSIRNQARYARVHNDSVISAPRFVGRVTTLDASTQVVGNRKPRDQVDELLINQTNLTVRFGSDNFRHTLVAGMEIADESTENRRRLDANGPATNLFDPVLQAAAPIPYNGTLARIDTDTMSFYLFDTIEIGPSFRIVGGLRYDDVETRVRGFDDNGTAPGFVTDLSARDNEWSYNLGLVYKPGEHSSLYFAYGTAFEPSGRVEVVQVAGGNNNPPVTPGNFFVDPEASEAWELGGRVETLGGAMTLSGALFQITRTNARTPGINPGDPAVVLEGEQRVRGFELQAIGAITPRWNVFAGYTYLSGKVTESNIPLEVGQRLDNLPRHSAVLWTSYAMTPDLLIGGGVQHVGSRRSDIRSSATGNIPIVTPAYTVLDAFAEYRITEAIGLRLNVYNITDELYFQSFSSGQSIPSAARSAVLTLVLDM